MQADAIEGGTRLLQVWTRLAPLLQAPAGSKPPLRAIFIECSFADPMQNSTLFGHLTPSLLVSELRRLAVLVSPSSPNTALTGLRVIVTHIKPVLELAADGTNAVNAAAMISSQLEALNDLGVQFQLAQTGSRILI